MFQKMKRKKKERKVGLGWGEIETQKEDMIGINMNGEQRGARLGKPFGKMDE